jgi:hypothetical protein
MGMFKSVLVIFTFLICSLPLQAVEVNRDYLENLDRNLLSPEQSELLNKALEQEQLNIVYLDDSNLPEEIKKKQKLKMKQVRRWLKTADLDKTCVDEYRLQRKRQMVLPIILIIDTGLGIFVTVASGGWVPALMVSYAIVRYALAEMIAMQVIRWKFPNNVPGDYPARLFDGIATGVTIATLVPYYAMAVVQTIKSVQTTSILKTLMNTHGFESKHPAQFLKHYLRKYPEDEEYINEEILLEILDEANSTNALCNGDIVKMIKPKRFRKGKKLRQRLARKKEIFKYIHLQLSQN